MKKRLLTIVLVFGSVALFAQSKIGSNAGTLQSGQLLELEKQGNRAGLKIAEVALTGNSDVTTVKLPSDQTKAKGTLIWNTATVAGVNGVSPGFYVWTGTLWERVNTGTVVPTVSNSSNTNSLTTTVNGVTGAAVAIVNSNALTAAANSIVSTVNGVSSTLTPAAGGTIAEILGFNSAGALVTQTQNVGNTPNIYTTDGTINGDRTVTIANGGTFYLRGQNNTIVNNGVSTNANLRIQGGATSAVLDIGNTNDAPYLQASNANDLSNSLPLLLNPNGGRVGIGNTTPAEALDVTGNVRLSGALMPGGAAGTTGQILTSAGAGAAPTWASASSLPVTVSNASSTNSLTTTVNGVTGTAVNIINGNTLTAASNAITSTVNGVTATLTPTAGGTITESLGFDSNGDLVRQATSSLNVPTFYTSNGSFDNRQVQITNGGTFYLIGQNSSVANSGTNTNANFRIQGTTNVNGLDIGNTNSAPYLQSNNVNDLSSSLPLLLNPNGGNVGIGTTSPSQALDVTGNVRLSGALMPGGAAGTTGQILTSAGAGAAPTWASASSLPVTVSNASSTNSLTTTVNGVTGTAVNIINGNALTAGSNTITSTVNGVTATLTPTAGGTIAENLGFNAAGNLVRQTASAANTPNIYSTDGTLAANRTVNTAGRSLSFLSNATGNLLLLNMGRTATEMDMGVAGVNGNGLAGTVPGDGWLASTTNLFVGTRGAGDFHLVTGTGGGATRMSISNAGNVGVGTTSPTERLDVSGNVRLSGALMPGGAAGTTGQILTSAGAGAAPTWASASSLPVTVSNASSTNSLTTTVNGVTGTAVNIINGNALTAGSNAITSTVNGVTATLTPTAGGTIAENLGFNAAGNLVRQTASAANTPNIYSTDGTLAANRTVNTAGRSLSFLSNATGNLLLLNMGRTATEMDMGVAGVNGNGLAGTVPGDGWLASTTNLFVGTRGAGDFHLVTGTGGGATRMSISNAGNVGVGTTSPTERLDVTGNIRFSGALMPNNAAGTAGQVLTSAGAGAPPTWTNATTQNIYSTDGTLAGNRTVTVGSNALNFRSNSLSTIAYFTYGRTATEMDMGVAGASGNGLDGVVPGDGWLAGTNNLFVGTRGTGSFRVVTGPAGSGVTRMLINNTGNVGISTTSPSQILDVAGTIKGTNLTNGTGAIGSTDFGLYSQNNNWMRYVTAGGNHMFFTDGSGGTGGNNWSGGTAAMALTSAGNLGIGTTSPAAKLDVVGTTKISGAITALSTADFSGRVTVFANSGTPPNSGNTNNVAAFRVGASNGDLNVLDFGTFTSPTISAYLQSTDRGPTGYAVNYNLLLNPNGGRVGVGLYNPLVKLHVGDGNFAVTEGGNTTSDLGNGNSGNNGFVVLQSGTASIETNTAAPLLAMAKRGATYNVSAGYIQFNGNGNLIGGIYSNTTRNGTIYSTTSDMRLKENIVPTHLGLSAVNDIKVYDYNFKIDPDKTQQTGFLAQELYKIFPQAVVVGGDDPKKNPWAVDYGKLTPLLVKAIQEQQLQIEALKKEIENLKNK